MDFRSGIPLVGPPTMITATTLSSELPIASNYKEWLRIGWILADQRSEEEEEERVLADKDDDGDSKGWISRAWEEERQRFDEDEDPPWPREIERERERERDKEMKKMWVLIWVGPIVLMPTWQGFVSTCVTCGYLLYIQLVLKLGYDFCPAGWYQWKIDQSPLMSLVLMIETLITLIIDTFVGKDLFLFINLSVYF